MRTRARWGALVMSVVVSAVVACGGDAPDAGADDAPAPGGAAGAVLGAAGRAQTSIMITEMRSNLGMMEASESSEMAGMIAAHRQRLGALIPQMQGDVGARGTDAWNATLDSLRQDLSSMQGMGASQIRSMMDGHARRLRRAMDMHREITGG